MKFIPVKILKYYQENPLQCILYAALFFRLIAAFFAKGYPFHDDHFCVIRPANNWAQGIPHWIDVDSPPTHSVFYAGINSMFMWVMTELGIIDPMNKVTVIRVIHAFYSLLIVSLSYKITEIIANRRTAILVGWILAILWFMPNFSVQFLAEVVCIPPTLAAFYFLAKDPNRKLRTWLIAGLFFGLAFTVRIHTVFFISGLGLLLLFQRKWMPAVMMSLGFLTSSFLITGVIDMIFWDFPFQSVFNYFAFHEENATSVVNGPVYRYLLTVLGFAVPPVSLILFWSYYRGRKYFLELFVASLFFFLFHSFFPHKQERFILPFFPFFIIIGIVGWEMIIKNIEWVKNRKRIFNSFWTFFWIMNILGASALALTYNRKDRVEPLYYLSSKTDVTSIVLESERSSPKQPPVYYLGQNVVDYKDFQNDMLGYRAFRADQKYLDPDFKFVFSFGSEKTISQLETEMSEMNKEPNYVIFKGSKGFDQRMERVKKVFPNKVFSFVKEIEPSNMDKLLHFLNPKRHRNNTALIYHLE
ncbi:MAG: glycosyltransferase family 39 protein [Bacteroidota bacterium]